MLGEPDLPDLPNLPLQNNSTSFRFHSTLFQEGGKTLRDLFHEKGPTEMHAHIMAFHCFHFANAATREIADYHAQAYFTFSDRFPNMFRGSV